MIITNNNDNNNYNYYYNNNNNNYSNYINAIVFALRLGFHYYSIE